MMNRLSNRKGFTLIELVVFISVIAIIASVAIPRYINLKRIANTAKIAGDLRMIDVAINQYYLQYRKYPLSNTNLSNSELVTSGKYFTSVPKPPKGEYYVSSTIGGVGNVSRYPGVPEYSIIAAHTADNILRRGALRTGVDLSTAEYFSDFKSLSDEFNIN